MSSQYCKSIDFVLGCHTPNTDLKYNKTPVMEPPADLVEELVRNLAASSIAYREWAYKDLMEHPDMLLCRIPQGVQDAGRPMFVLRNATNELVRGDVPLYSVTPVYERLLAIVKPSEGSERTCESVTTVSS
jgi:hypothetical protein